MANRKSRGSSSKQLQELDDVSESEFGSVRSVLEELAQSGRKLKKSSKGHRDVLRDTLQTAQRIIAKFLDNESWQKQFVRAVKGEKEESKKSSPSNWCLEVVAKATGASSRKARKLASKRAAVLELLRERDVPVENTATTLKKEGLERLYSEKCKKKKATRAPAASSKRPSTPNQEVSLLLWMKRSNRQQLMDQEVGTKSTILVSRVNESDGDFQVKGVLAVNSLGETADDWAE
jgi:hypothetical protein